MFKRLALIIASYSILTVLMIPYSKAQEETLPPLDVDQYFDITELPTGTLELALPSLEYASGVYTSPISLRDPLEQKREQYRIFEAKESLYAKNNDLYAPINDILRLHIEGESLNAHKKFSEYVQHLPKYNFSLLHLIESVTNKLSQYPSQDALHIVRFIELYVLAPEPLRIGLNLYERETIQAYLKNYPNESLLLSYAFPELVEPITYLGYGKTNEFEIQENLWNTIKNNTFDDSTLYYLCRIRDRFSCDLYAHSSQQSDFSTLMSFNSSLNAMQGISYRENKPSYGFVNIKNITDEDIIILLSKVQEAIVKLKDPSAQLTLLIDAYDITTGPINNVAAYIMPTLLKEIGKVLENNPELFNTYYANEYIGDDLSYSIYDFSRSRDINFTNYLSPESILRSKILQIITHPENSPQSSFIYQLIPTFSSDTPLRVNSLKYALLTELLNNHSSNIEDFIIGALLDTDRATYPEIWSKAAKIYTQRIRNTLPWVVLQKREIIHLLPGQSPDLSKQLTRATALKLIISTHFHPSLVQSEFESSTSYLHDSFDEDYHLTKFQEHISKNDWFTPYVWYAKAHGILMGDSPLRLGDPISKAEFLTMLLRIPRNIKLPNSPTPHSSDISTGTWFESYMKDLYSMREAFDIYDSINTSAFEPATLEEAYLWILYFVPLRK